MLTIHLPSVAGRIGELVADVPSRLSLTQLHENKKKDLRFKISQNCVL
jgi:hypothetical protein